MSGWLSSFSEESGVGGSYSKGSRSDGSASGDAAYRHSTETFSSVCIWDGMLSVWVLADIITAFFWAWLRLLATIVGSRVTLAGHFPVSVGSPRVAWPCWPADWVCPMCCWSHMRVAAGWSDPVAVWNYGRWNLGYPAGAGWFTCCFLCRFIYRSLAGWCARGWFIEIIGKFPLESDGGWV